MLQLLIVWHIGALAAKVPGESANRPALDTSPDLPVLIINTHGQTVQDRSRTPCHLTVLTLRSSSHGGFSPDDGSGNAEISVRGNSSFYFSKKNYRLELQDGNGNDRKAPLLGLPADSDWVLYASATDRTFVRNLLAHELWRATGRYSVRWRFVEVFVVTNSESKELEVDRPHPGQERTFSPPRLRPQPQEKEALIDRKFAVNRPHPIHESDPGRSRGNETQTSSKQTDQSLVTSTPMVQRLAEEVPRVLEALAVTNPAAASLSFAKASNTVASTLAESYMGVYVLMEKIKRGKQRVNIKRLRPEHTTEPEISGGYIFKKDDQGHGERGLLTGQEFKLRFEEPKETELTAVQRAWLGRYLDDFEQALFGLKFRDPVNGYGKYLDVDSFIDFHWLVEVSRNADGYSFSQYMHKDRSGKLTMGPVWDWDNTFGNPYFNDSSNTNRWRFESATDPNYTWYRRLFEDPDFLQRYIDRWSELRTNVLATSNVVAIVSHVSNELKGAHRRNAMKWEREGPKVTFRAKAGISYEDELNWLKQWITSRLSWIDSQEFPKPVAQTVREEPSGPPRIALAWLNGRLFYTTDGTDPRAPGGGVASAAREYASPIAAPEGAVITARVRSEFGLWSAPLRTSGAGPERRESK